jgi:long-subunit acyl-CoA synthetase (AMP-forming)
LYYGIYKELIIAYAESMEKVVENMGEIRPHYLPSVPRVFEKAYATIIANVKAGSPLKKKSSIGPWGQAARQAGSSRQKSPFLFRIGWNFSLPWIGITHDTSPPLSFPFSGNQLKSQQIISHSP